jgi:hypothetical protein
MDEICAVVISSMPLTTCDSVVSSTVRSARTNGRCCCCCCCVCSARGDVPVRETLSRRYQGAIKALLRRY